MDEEFKSRYIGIIGMGYVGLPLALMFVEKHHKVLGIDLDRAKIENLSQGKSYISDVSDEQVKQLMLSGKFQATSDYNQISDLDVIIICVPTPLDHSGGPNLSYIESAGKEIVKYGSNNQLVILESSTYPGTTEEVLLPILEKGGRKVGSDFYLAYSPERINPGDKQFRQTSMPKIVSGITEQCLQQASSLYSTVFERVVPVSSIRAAEMVKVLENSQRFINISFLNEVVKFCEKMEINLWEVIDAVNTKPYGNLYFYPGSGIGGHCIPIDPLYLDWKAEQVGVPLQYLQISKQVNDSMPMYIVDRIRKILPNSKRLKDASILLLGLTYKKDVNDLRESSALQIMSILAREGVKVQYHDPFVPEVTLNEHVFRSMDLSPEILNQMDCVVLLTNHSSLPVEFVVSHSRLFFDTRNVTKNDSSLSHVVRL